MKWLLIVLILFNVLFFLFTEMRTDRATESLLAHQNLSSEKIHVLDSGEPVSPGAATTTASAAAARCVEWGPIDSDKLSAIRKATGTLAISGMVREKAQAGSRWWVYLPPLASEAQANERVAALKSSGVSDVLVIRNDPFLNNGISLGVFNDEDAAKTQLAELARKGVADARVISRAKPDSPTSLIFSLGNTQAEQEFGRLKQAYPAIAERDAACPV